MVLPFFALLGGSRCLRFSMRATGSQSRAEETALSLHFPIRWEDAPGITMVLLAFGTLVHRLSLPFEFRLIKVLEALALPIRNTLLVSLGAQIESNLHGY